MAEQSLKTTTLKGTGWSFADNLANQGVTFLVGLILARLLSPEEYGLIGIITIFINVFSSIVDSGFSNALIRKNDSNNADYNTVFWSNLVISIALVIVLFVCSNPIAVFFRQPQLKLLTQVMSSILVINAFAIIQRTLFVKAIDFKTQTKASLIASISSGIVGVILAVRGFGVWSLVWQQIIRQGLNTLFLWIFSKWRPKLFFSWESFKSLFNFGWKLMVSTLINTIWNELYKVVIGKTYTANSLGLYTRAEQFSNIFSSNITNVVNRVTYPVLSSIQDDAQRLKNAYRRIIKTSMLITFSLMLGLVGVADNFVYVLVGPQWHDCVPMLQILCFTMMLYPLHAINLNMLQVQGRSDLFLKLEIIKKIAAIGPLLLGIFVGVYWMLISGVIVGFYSYYLNASYSGRFIDYSIQEQMKDILPSFVISLVMSFLVYLESYLHLSPFILLPIQIISGFFIIVGLCELIKLPEYIELKDFVKARYNSL